MTAGVRGPSREEILAAQERIAPYIRATPVMRPGPGSFGLNLDPILKLELLQHTGSFKPRGAFNKLLVSEVPSAGVVAASGGNFGLAVAHACRVLGFPAEIFVPSTSPRAKIDRVLEHGARVHVIDGYYDDAARAAEVHRDRLGALAMHPFDQPEVVAGQGTIGIELEATTPDIDTVLVAVGGGGLIGGIASWYDGRVRVVGVEPRDAASLHAALASGEPVDVPVRGVAADSLGAGRTGDIAFAVAQRSVDRVVLVEDDDIRGAQRAIWRELRLVAEPGGAAALAAVMSGAYRPDPGERVAVLVCGANAAPSDVTG